ncbi:hypothetical protein AGMMS49975_20210 [Clostridia bacterium]|nr:hypothetical protein AGMMS49975_20210 [Clostridia bacterium]
MANRKPRPVIGVSGYTIAELLTDTATGRTYGTPIQLPGTVQIAATDTANAATFDADDGAYESVSYIENRGHTLTTAALPPDISAKMKGALYVGGVYHDNDWGNPPEFAAMWRVLKSNDKYRYTRELRGKYSFASNVGGQTKPSSGAPNFQTATATYKSLKTADGGYREFIDEDEVVGAMNESDELLYPEITSREILEANFFSNPYWKPDDGDAVTQSITINPATATVAVGGNQEFTASLKNITGTPTFAVTGGTSGDTVMTGGVLTVGADETGATLAVTATIDTVSATAAVTVTGV